MWFNDIDIELRLSARPDGIAPERHRAALARYLERKRQREAAGRRVKLPETFARAAAVARSLAKRFRQRPGPSKRRNRAAVLAQPFAR